LFGLLAVELGLFLASTTGPALSRGLAVAFLAVGVLFVWRSFYRMRIETAH
jgi:K(+)-stimulated pyrophosphate-energized sodium pump